LAMQVREQVMCDRLIANRETSRNILYKDHERRQRRVEKAEKRLAAKNKIPPNIPDKSTNTPK
jgi:hypothetical protein